MKRPTKAHNVSEHRPVLLADSKKTENQDAAKPQPPENIITNSIGMIFAYIRPGEFLMGSPKDEPGHSSFESPRHKVTIVSGFYIMTTEVTQKQWKAVMGNNPSHFQECGDDCPVESVSWVDVQKFIKKLNETEGGAAYRLPSEAEWEYAARAGTQTAFANGHMLEAADCGIDPRLNRIGWYCGNSEKKTHPAAQKPPNAWGLYDMHGNVWEWCEDDFHYNYKNAPSDGSPWIAEPEGEGRVLRGGSWSAKAQNCSSANRIMGSTDYGTKFGGFRLVKTCP